MFVTAAECITFEYSSGKLFSVSFFDLISSLTF